MLLLSACSKANIISDNEKNIDTTKVVKGKTFQTFNYKDYDANYYLIANNGEGVLIDSGECYDEISKYIKINNIKLKYIFLTHGHNDHVLEAYNIREEFSAKIVIHKFDNKQLKKTTSVDADVLLEGGEFYEVGGMKFEFLHTPGHTKGSMSIICDGNAFTGDTLFKSSIGRTDFEGGSYVDIINSIKEKLLILDEKTVVYPGHQEKTSIGSEKKENRFLN